MLGQPRNARRAPSFGDAGQFLRSLVATPHLTGAVAPSSRALARTMAARVDPATPGLVVELGPGTGPVTKALIERGIDRRRLVLVEFNPMFCRLLENRFAPARIVEGDAYDLPRTLHALAAEPVSAVVSSLPLLVQPPPRRQRLLDDAFALMGSRGVFVQFTYGPASPVPLRPLVGLYTARRSPPIWLNLPPARVWTYRLDPERRGGGGHA